MRACVHMYVYACTSVHKLCFVFVYVRMYVYIHIYIKYIYDFVWILLTTLISSIMKVHRFQIV